MNVIKESYKYAKRYLPAYISVIICGFITIAAIMLLPQIPQLIIDRIINPALGAEVKIAENNVFTPLLNGFADTDYMGMLTTLLITMAIILVVRYTIFYIRWNVSHAYGVRTEKKLRLAVMDKMLSQNSLVMSRYTSGDMLSICNNDTIYVKNIWSQDFSIIIDQITAIIVAVFFLSRIDYRLVFVPAGLGIATSIVTIFYTRALRKCYNRIRESSASLNTCVQENINGVRVIRAYASENAEIERFDSRNKIYRDNYVSQSRIMAKYSAIFSFLGQGVTLGSMILGVILAANGSMTAGEFLTFSSYIMLISNPIITLASYIGTLQNAMVCGGRLFTFMNTKNIICDPENPLEITSNPSFAMHNVSIKLDENEELKEVSVDIPYGKKLGIMGKTGSGKSVMIKALTRLFETTHGETMLNGSNIKNYRVEDIRRQFSYVMQDTFLFSNTVDSNIAYYNPDIGHDAVERVARIAQADDFIKKMPQGYETVIGEKGLGLSGGQKQRVSIARSLLKDSPVIILDDSTSALDLSTERKILKGINENYADRTLIIASHRTSSVEACDEILYLENGRIVERGSHKELLDLQGKYYEVYQSQQAAMTDLLT